MITSYRVRSLYISKERVDPNAIKTYQDPLKPEFKGKVAVRSGFHLYNVSLWCQMAEAEGIEATKAFLTGLKANLARALKSNDRGQVQAIHDGVADVSIGNYHYYMGIMLNRDDQRSWALATDVHFNQTTKGLYVMQAAAGLDEEGDNTANATKLLEYLVGDFAQFFMANALHVYPVNDKLPLSEFNRGLGTNQEEVVDGRIKVNFLPLRAVNKHREAVTKILTELDFDNP